MVSRIIVQVELATAQGRTDINLALEDAFIPVLRSAFNLPQLYNLNRKQKNFPGIDLGDEYDRVAFQVTATTSLEKVKDTLRQFMDRQYYNSFDELYVLTLVKKQNSYSQVSVNQVLNEHFAFNTKTHIIDLSDVLGKIAGLRLAAQQRVLTEFKRILGEVDAFISYSRESIPAPQTITSNLQEIGLPEHVYVAELVIDEKAVLQRAKDELGYKGKASKKRSTVKMALLLNGEDSDAWVYHDGKLFSFRNIEESGLSEIVDEGSIERLEADDLAGSDIVDNVNVFKQLLVAETQERLKRKNVRLHSKDRFFYFCPLKEGDHIRREKWVGLRKSERMVYEVKSQKKDPTKTSHHRHFSFELSFVKIAGNWYAQIVPNWYYSYNGFARSFWHQDFLSKQKRLELNQSVRNFVRFTAYFLAHLDEEPDCRLTYRSLVVFNAEDDGDGRDDAADDDLAVEEAAG